MLVRLKANMFMEHIDTLVLSVQKKKLTEAEAMRRYTEFAPISRDIERSLVLRI